MGKKKAADADAAPQPEIPSVYIGADTDDDIMEMQYIQDETNTTKVDTHPPETKEEAEEMRRLATESEPEEAEAVEDEVVAEEKAKPEAEAEAELEPEPEDIQVPKSRFDEVNNRMKAAEQKAKELEEKINALSTKHEEPVEDKAEPEPEPFDYTTKEKEAMNALLEGDEAQYLALREEIRQAERTEALREAKKLASEGDQQSREALEFTETGRQIESEYPQLVPETDGFNKDAYDEVMELYVGYSRTGQYSRSEALRKATDKAAKIHGLNKASAKPTPDNVVSITDKKQPNLSKKAEVANNQPPVMQSGVEQNDEPSTDILSMSDEEFNALPEASKRRLRGDVI